MFTSQQKINQFEITHLCDLHSKNGMAFTDKLRLTLNTTPIWKEWIKVPHSLEFKEFLKQSLRCKSKSKTYFSETFWPISEMNPFSLQWWTPFSRNAQHRKNHSVASINTLIHNWNGELWCVFIKMLKPLQNHTLFEYVSWKIGIQHNDQIMR